MKRILTISTLLISFIISSCNSNSTEKTLTKLESLRIAINEFNQHKPHKKTIDLSKLKGIFIIPNSGCDGCISTAETFVIDNYDAYDDLLIIFTRVSSLKSLKVRSNNGVISSDLTIIDQQNRFSLDSLNSVYPLVAFVKNSTITSIEEQSPLNLGLLSKLTDHLSK